MPQRIAIAAPSGRDAAVIAHVLDEAAISSRIETGLDGLVDSLAAGKAGAAIIAEEAFGLDGVAKLSGCLARQPPWSDIPVLLLARSGQSRAAHRIADELGNVTILERPLHALALASAARTALRARARQHDAADYIREIATVSERLRDSERALLNLNARLETRIADALAEKRLLADIVEGTDVFVQVADMEFRWLAINRAAASEFERIFGIRPMVGQSMLDVLSTKPEHRSAVEAVWGRAISGQEFTEVGEFGDSDLDRRYYEMKFNILRDPAGQQIGAYQFVTDVTTRITGERQLAEANAKMRQMAKIETLGQLTGGVAHDFNNLLTPIVGALDILQRRHAESASSLRLISGAQQAADRATSLVQRLLAFARQQKLRTEIVDLAKLIDGLRELLRQTLGPGVTLLVDMETGVPPVRIDPAQLELALINLAVNARDAMNDAGALTIAVASSLPPSDDDSPPLSGDHVCLSVTDTGPGMDEDMIEKAIEPFFTTKGVGKGTGLGLSMVHGVVAQFGGNLRLLSPPGAGLRAEIWLPLAKDADQDQADVSRTPDRRELPSLRVLLVDDDDLVRSSLHETLVEMGMDVTDAATAQEALASLSQKTFDLLLTDLLMPGMRGDDLVREACTLYPHVGALLMTGYAGTLYDRIDRATLISKPVKAPDLAAAILELHARGSNGSAKVVAGR